MLRVIGQKLGTRFKSIMTANTLANLCQGAGCGKMATLVCPTCLKLNLPKDSARFCSQTCFKSNWTMHKSVHTQAQAFDPFIADGSFKYTGALRAAYPLSAARTVPPDIDRPDYAETGRSISEEREKASYKIPILSADEIEMMRKVALLGRQVLDATGAAVKPGITSDELDRIVHDTTISLGAYPSPLNYAGFPKSCCISVNEVICHGIPDQRKLQDGDIVNIDVSVYKDGFHTDLNETYLVGDAAWNDKAAVNLVDTTRECLKASIEACRPGMFYRDLGNIIEKIAKKRGCSVVRTYCGHGINRLFHGAPNIPHYAKNKAVGVMKPGHVFTIEPMINEGGWQDEHWPDNWTCVTRDGRRSAQFEHTLLVTEEGCEVLTLAKPHDVVMDGLKQQ